MVFGSIIEVMKEPNDNTTYGRHLDDRNRNSINHHQQHDNVRSKQYPPPAPPSSPLKTINGHRSTESSSSYIMEEGKYHQYNQSPAVTIATTNTTMSTDTTTNNHNEEHSSLLVDIPHQYSDDDEHLNDDSDHFDFNNTLKQNNNLNSNSMESMTEIFGTLRVNQMDNDNTNRMKDINISFWDDLYHMTPGSVPHSMIVGAVIGVMCGILAYLYYTVLEYLIDFFWKILPNKLLVPYIPIEYHWIWIIIIGYSMALGVGISIKYLGEPGDLSFTVQCVHDKGYIDMDHVLPMLMSSQFSILGGGSLGPEAPLVAICASFSGYISRHLFQQNNINLIRKHTLMGMSCALSSFFGVPLGGSIFALEINNRFGIEYYEHTIEAIYSGTICLCVFRSLTNLNIGPIWNISDIPLPTCTTNDVLIGAFLGLIGACIASIFSYVHQNMIMIQFKKWNLLNNNDNAIQRAFIGSTFIILIGLFIPQTMFWGESEFQMIATTSSSSDLPHIYPTTGLIHFEMKTIYQCLLVGIMKMVAISFTVASGYRGGFIFPFFAAGAAFGQAFYIISGGTIPIQLCILCIAASINVAITRTSIATTLILTALSGELNANPPILAASIVSLLLTSYMPFIRGQSKRKDIIRQSESVLNGPRSMKQRKIDYGSTTSLKK